MRALLLDIGAGGSSFARLFLKHNPHLHATAFCGEPAYGNLWDRITRFGRVQNVVATYSDFPFSPSSLDIVTLNAYHPFQPPIGIEEEVLRCLKPGGLFISAHPIGLHPECTQPGLQELRLSDSHTGRESEPQMFEKSGRFFWWYFTRFVTARYGVIVYPASPTIAHRLWILSPQGESFRYSEACNGYVYRNTHAFPTVRVWVRE